MKNEDVVALQTGLNAVSQFVEPKFVIVVSHNKIRIKRLMQERETMLNDLEGVDMKEYKEVSQRINKDRNELCVKWAAKDDNGKPILKGTPPRQFYDIPDQEGFNAECDEALKLDQGVINEMDKIRGDVLKVWNEEEATLELYSISEENLPTTINSTQLEGIIWMVTELREDLLGKSNLEKVEAPIRAIKPKSSHRPKKR